MTSDVVPLVITEQLQMAGFPVISEGQVAKSEQDLYLRWFWLPGRPQPLGLGQGKRIKGIVHVDVVGKLTGGAGETALFLIGLFPAGAAFPRGDSWVRVDNSYQLAGRTESGRYIIPVRIEIHADIKEGQP